MPQIIVAADRGAAFGDGAVTFRERVNVADFESGHFAAQLVERLGWAVEDADAMENVHPDADEPQPDPDEIRADPPDLRTDPADRRTDAADFGNEPERARRESVTAGSPV